MSEQTITTRTVRVWLGADGIVYTESLPGSEQTGADAETNMAAIWEVADRRKRPLMGDMRRMKAMDRDARVHYVTSGPSTHTAAALLVDSPLSRVLGNFFMGLNKPLIPTRLFATEGEAAAWLRTFITSPSPA